MVEAENDTSRLHESYSTLHLRDQVALITPASKPTNADREGLINVFELAQGDCFIEPSEVGSNGRWPDEIEVASCDEPHDKEVLVAGVLPNEPNYPAVNTLWDRTQRFCEAHFREYTGSSYGELPVVIGSLVPDESDWDNGKRTVTCLLTHESGRTLNDSLHATPGMGT